MFVEEPRARREQGVLQGLGSPLLPVASDSTHHSGAFLPKTCDVPLAPVVPLASISPGPGEWGGLRMPSCPSLIMVLLKKSATPRCPRRVVSKYVHA